MKTLNWCQSGSSFLANLKVVSMSSLVSPGIPSIKEMPVSIFSSLHSLNARSACSTVIPLFIILRIFGAPDSTPNQIVWHPADFIAFRTSRETRSTPVSHAQTMSRLRLFISLQISIALFLFNVKLSPTK